MIGDLIIRIVGVIFSCGIMLIGFGLLGIVCGWWK